MEAQTAKRLNRKFFWIGLVAIFVVKYLMTTYLGRSTIWLDVFLAILVIFRGQDFKLSAGFGLILWLACALALPLVGASLSTDDTVGLFGLPILLLYLIFGLVPGTRGANRYGEPAKGFSALKAPVPSTEAPNSMPQPRRVQRAPQPSLATQPRAAFGQRS